MKYSLSSGRILASICAFRFRFPASSVFFSFLLLKTEYPEFALACPASLRTRPSCARSSSHEENPVPSLSALFSGAFGAVDWWWRSFARWSFRNDCHDAAPSDPRTGLETSSSTLENASNNDDDDDDDCWVFDADLLLEDTMVVMYVELLFVPLCSVTFINFKFLFSI